MSLVEFIQQILGRLYDEYITESARVWTEFLDTLGEIWDPSTFDLGDLINPSRFGVSLILRVIATWDAFQELAQDLSLIPFRIGVDIVDDLIPVPDNFKGRVIRADQALRFIVREGLEFGVDILDLDLPAMFDAIKAGKLAFTIREFITRAGERVAILRGALRANLWVTVVLLIGTILKWIAFIVMILWVVNVLIRMHGPEGEAMLAERALPQNSKRVRSNLGRRQHRVNQRTGAD